MIEKCFKIEVATDDKHFDMFREIYARTGTSNTPLADTADKVFAVGIKAMWKKLQRRKRK